ncbi:hypothetical protein [Lysinibacter cavernae]|uniref:Quinol-cytochrome oxidoreductase complex cytochrome b subunit n=1 Tax=Lysinibacter cavernae TaxID=1640652 RepID=A0A7X5R0S5_9MICO|nr:hypothetical protein [Lysinibacter cavernae]NIH53488.1 quinol-cytochrome oxidoreductase complex cytochrome b subunit [Lysinibacter cavernae]
MIDWAAFLIVFVTAIVSACVVVSLYSFGIRFSAMPAPRVRREDGTLEPVGDARDAEDDGIELQGRPRWATWAANICFGLCVVVVLFGIYLIVPALHVK